MRIGNVEQLVQRVAALNGGPFLSPTTILTASMREALRELAVEYGMSHAIAEKVSSKDLVSLYSVARKSPVSAQQVADRIAAKHAYDPFAGVEAPKSALIEAKGIYQPAKPEALPSAPAGDWQGELDRLKSELRETVDRRLRSFALDMTTDEDFDRIKALAELTADKLDALMPSLDTAIKLQVAEALKVVQPVTLEITRGADPVPLKLGTVHRATPDILKALSAGVNVYLYGPAGSGKTTAARKCAEALGVQFYFAAKVESEYLLLGFRDATGGTVRTQFREAYEHGGVFLFDEIDASSPSAVVAMNAALANGVCPFPDGIVQRHKDFYCIAAGNTKLTGASREYNGRVQLDAASVDRFAFLEFGYDEPMEMALATNSGWCLHVQALRKAVKDRGLSHLITPRATFDGCKLLDAGFDWTEVENMSVFKGLDPATAEQLRNAASIHLVSGAA